MVVCVYVEKDVGDNGRVVGLLTGTKKVCVGGIWRFRGQQGDVDTGVKEGRIWRCSTLKSQKWKADGTGLVAVGGSVKFIAKVDLFSAAGQVD